MQFANIMHNLKIFHWVDFLFLWQITSRDSNHSEIAYIEKQSTCNWNVDNNPFTNNCLVLIFICLLQLVMLMKNTLLSTYKSSSHYHLIIIIFHILFPSVLISILVQLKNWDKVLWWMCLVTYPLLVLFAVLWKGFSTTFPVTYWKSCCNATMGICWA